MVYIVTPDIVEEVIVVVENQLQSLSDNQKRVLREWLTSAVDHHIGKFLEEEKKRIGDEAIESLKGIFGLD
jgi:hypothetical protein